MYQTNAEERFTLATKNQLIKCDSTKRKNYYFDLNNAIIISKLHGQDEPGIVS